MKYKWKRNLLLHTEHKREYINVVRGKDVTKEIENSWRMRQAHIEGNGEIVIYVYNLETMAN